MSIAVRLLKLVLLLAAMQFPNPAVAEAVELFDGRELASIVHSEGRTSALAAELLARDLSQLTGATPEVSTDLAACRRLCIVIGPRDSALIGAVAQDTDVELSDLQDQWERYARVAVR